MRLSPEEKIAAQWFALTFHSRLTHRKVHDLIHAWCNTAGQRIEGLLRLGPSDWDACKLDTEQCAALAQAKGSLSSASQMIERLHQNGIHLISADQPDYPTLLTSTQEEARPPLLFCVGDLRLLNRPAVAIIGSRQPKPEALEFTRDAAQRFAARGIPIVSGFAEGVDRCASAAALAAGGTTVLVIAQGILTFSAQIKALQAGISRGQILIVSAFHPEADWETPQAMARNAIISALSHDVIVSQAGLKGGSWEASRMALNQGRPVWVRNDLDANLGHRALADLGARPVEWPPSKSHDWTRDTVCVTLVELAQTRYDAAWTEAWLLKACREHPIPLIVRQCGIPTEKARRICQVRGKAALRGFEDLIKFCDFTLGEIAALGARHGMPPQQTSSLRDQGRVWTEKDLLNLFRTGSASEIHEASGLTGHILRRIIEGRRAIVLESLQDLRKIKGIGPAAIEHICRIFRLWENNSETSKKSQPFQLSLFPEAKEFSDWESRLIKPLDEMPTLEETSDYDSHTPTPPPSGIPRSSVSRKPASPLSALIRKTHNRKSAEEEEKVPSVVRPDELDAGDFVPVLQTQKPPSPRRIPQPARPSKSGKPLNLLLILASQMRADALGCYGNTEAHTPNLDRLAAEGARVERAYTVTTQETAARAAMFTSRLPATSGLWMNGQALPETSQTLATQMAQAGYDTGWIGKLHLSPYLAPESAHSVESLASWKAGLMREWTGPAWGFQFLQLLLGNGLDMFEQGHFAEQIMLRYRPILDKFRPTFRQALQHFPLGLSTEEWPNVLQPNNWIASHTAQYLKQHGKNPFFLALGFPGPAAPYMTPRAAIPSSKSLPGFASASSRREPSQYPPHYSEISKKGERFDNARFEPCAGERERQLRAGYLESVTQVDNAVGKILKKLEEQGLSESTLVVFTSDCGSLLGEFGFWGSGPFHLEGLLRVPLLFRLPGKIPSGLRLDEPVSLLDLAPTLCGFLRGRIPAEYEGVSLHQVLLGEQTLPPREALLVQSVSRRNPGLALHSVITHEAKMTCYPGHPWGEFYHLIEDPQETRNLYRELSGDIRSKYYEHLLNMLDPTRFLPPLPEWET